MCTPLQVGIDSLSATHFVTELRERSGIDSLSPTLVFDYSTAEAIAGHLTQLAVPGAQTAGFGFALETSGTCPDIEGMAGRWPKGSEGAADLWQLSANGMDVVGVVPARRWVVDPTAASAEHVKTASHFASVHGAELFDNVRLNVGRSEAVATDPQQRLLLEYGYAALHASAYSRNELQGSDTGVFLGITNADFATFLVGSTSVYAATGGTISIASGRTSFVLGLQGPCESIDTACSSAIVAVHSAALSINKGDCAIALATAVNIMLAPHVSISYAAAGMLSPDGRCKTWDAQANGYVRGEGVGGLVLSRAQTLQESKDSNAQATLDGSAVRQDGKSASLTAPSGSAQISLIGLAVARATADTALLTGVESHGTGTPLGDPTEVRALTAALPERAAGHSLGGVKANAGHLEPAAGIIGLAKVLATLDQKKAAPNAQLRDLNPHLAGAVSSLQLHAEVGSLVPHERTLGGISSFGYSGTIAHAVLCSVGVAPAAPAAPSAPLKYRRLAFPWEMPKPKAAAGGAMPLLHTPFLGVPVSTFVEDLVWEQQFATHELLFLRNHRVGEVGFLVSLRTPHRAPRTAHRAPRTAPAPPQLSASPL